MQKRNIKTLSLDELKELFESYGEKPFRLQQLIQWLYDRQVSFFDEMTDMKKDLREKLNSEFFIGKLNKTFEQESIDGTRKYLFKLEDGKTIESVFIPSEKRNTLCVSSQVGCAMDCQFCLTATMGLFRNLSLFEIVDQVGAVIRDLKERSDPRKLTNLVFMGMGEPLANHKNLYAALSILLNDRAFNFSKNHITVSTSGLAPEIEKFGDKTTVNLAISLNATTDQVRDEVMPINKKYPLQRLFESCQKMNLPKRKRITFEYVMLHGVNDSLEDARRLVKILSKLRAKVNLLPFNEFPDSPYKRPPDDWVLKFQKILLDKGFVAVIRRSRGRDILGACGQLATQKKVA